MIEIADTPLALARAALANAESLLAQTGINRRAAEKKAAEAAAVQDHLTFYIDALRARIATLQEP